MDCVYVWTISFRFMMSIICSVEKKINRPLFSSYVRSLICFYRPVIRSVSKLSTCFHLSIFNLYYVYHFQFRRPMLFSVHFNFVLQLVNQRTVLVYFSFIDIDLAADVTNHTRVIIVVLFITCLISNILSIKLTPYSS